MSDTSLLLSIRPEHAEKIFGGTKKAELRRVRPGVTNGDKVFVYVSSPVKALLGVFEVDRVIEASPNNLWNSVNLESGITREQFDNYYAGASVAFGIMFSRVWCFREPIKLERLRQLLSGFCPPQSQRYLSLKEANLLGALDANGILQETWLPLTLETTSLRIQPGGVWPIA